MTRVVSTLKSYYHISFFGKPINNFTFSFISPLGAYDSYVRH